MAYRTDPYAETTKSAGKRFRSAIRLCFYFLAVLWALVLINGMPGIELRPYGVHPRDLDGLIGLFSMPLLHGGIVHMANNALPLLLLGTGLFWFYPHTAWKVIPWFWVLPGLFVWLIGADGSNHIGLSGFNFALLGYVALGGFLRRDAGTLSLSVAVLFYYGGMFSGIFPTEKGISWEGHLGGLLTGFAFAIRFRRTDVPEPKRYSWEDEDQAEDELMRAFEAFNQARERDRDGQGPTLH